VGKGERMGAGAGGKNDPNNVCTYEYMNNKYINKYIYIYFFLNR
jgi:hypothetical protein